LVFIEPTSILSTPISSRSFSIPTVMLAFVTAALVLAGFAAAAPAATPNGIARRAAPAGITGSFTYSSIAC
jgi:hypothetical protein